MYFLRSILFVSLAISTVASPTPSRKRADLLQAQDYSQFQVSDGVAGNALEEVSQKFPIDQFRANPNVERQPDAASTFADTRYSKIKNKVLKLELEVLALQIEQAQGDGDQAKIDEEQTKLNNNIATDKASAGDQSQSVNFVGSSQP